MRNFVRALRHAWPYRLRLFVSVICAICAAILWSLNFTAIYPVLTILGSEKNLQDWVKDSIDNTRAEIERLQPLLDAAIQAQEVFEKRTRNDEHIPRSWRDRREKELASDLARVESKLNAARTELYRYQLAKVYVIRFLPTDRFRTLAYLIGLVVLAVAVKGIFEFGQDSLVGSVVNLSLYDLRNRFFRNVIHLDVNNFSDDQGTSEVMARFTNDMELLGQGTKTLFGKVIAEPLKALCCVVWAAWISWQLTLMFLVLVPVAVFVLGKVGRMMKRATRHLLERMSSIYKILQETFQGIRIVKAFTMEAYERRRFHAATKEYAKKSQLVVNIDALASPVTELMGVAAVALALLAGAYLVMEHETKLPGGIRMSERPLDTPALLQLYALLAAIADPVRKLSSVYTRLQSGAAAADRIFAFVDRQPRVRANSQGVYLPWHRDTIEFRALCFSYEPDRPLLTNINLTCKFGETIALVGKNGCGKTTLLGLIPRFYDPDHGSILVDGIDIRTVHLRSLRQQVGMVTQDVLLFDDTICNNVSYGKRSATREEVAAACKQAFIHDRIMILPQGYDTRVGEAALKLSGGERQKIALARAILRNPRILILDEFTSQIDAESEAEIHKALREFMRNRTTFVITHRLNTLEIADRIVVLDDGRIEAVGTHQELMLICTVYQRLHDAHFLRQCA